MKYSIVIPTYNHCNDLLKPCLEAILKYSTVSDLEIIVSANGCTDNTLDYLNKLKASFDYLGLSNNFKVVWHNEPLGYAKATNAGIKLATSDKIILLNNDAILLSQNKDDWLNLLSSAFNDPKCGIACSLRKYSSITKLYFGLFYCAMIDRKMFDLVGLIDERYEVGGNEDIDFCAAIQLLGYEVIQPVPNVWDPAVGLHVGTFPLWHKGEATVHDPTLVTDWEQTFRKNELLLALKYNNMEWYLAHKDSIKFGA